MRLVAFMLLLAACSKEREYKGPKLADVLATDGPRLVPLVAAIEKIGARVAAEPVTPLDLKGEQLRYATIISDEKQKPNAKLLYARDIKVGWLGPIDYRIYGSEDLAHCYQLGKTGALPPKEAAKPLEVPTGGWARHVIEECDGVKYAIVIRAERDTVKTDNDTRTFTGGMESGDVLVYNLDTGAYYGSFHYLASIGDQLTSKSGNPEHSLSSAVGDEIEKTLKKTPGATVIARAESR